MTEELKPWYTTKMPPPSHVYQLDPDLDMLFDGMDDVGIGPRFIGEIRKGEWYVELGGPRQEYKSFLSFEIVDDPETIKDGRITLVGPELDEIPEETALPFGMHFKIWGPRLRTEHTDYVTRSCAMGLLHTEGVGFLSGLEHTWARISKEVAPRMSFKKLAQLVRANIMTSTPIVESVETMMIVASEEVGGRKLIEDLMDELRPAWEARKALDEAVADEEVETFYGCTLCKMIAPNHTCVITPAVIPYCGVITFQSSQAGYEIDPHGYVFSIDKGETLDSVAGHYSGVDEEIYQRSNLRTKRVHVHSVLKYPTTNCGCFEACAYYIPEVDGIGLGARRYTGQTPIGLPFSKIAGVMSGGIQNHGFKGVSLRSIKSPKFLMGDGGWDRIVWAPKDVKMEIADSIPEEVYDKIATEEDCIDPTELEAFLSEKKHPIVEKYWKDGKPVPLDLPMPGEDWPE
ncbi:CO dehydrogenase/CO-methylating acetyl-CoA synthase complex subunit beta [Chloroflexota bacterium]